LVSESACLSLSSRDLSCLFLSLRVVSGRSALPCGSLAGLVVAV
jgi:hypothetical protein